MKKYLALLLAGLMLTGAILTTACGESESSSKDDDDKEKTTASSDSDSEVKNPSGGKTFTAGGLTLTLSSEFKQTSDTVLETDDVVVIVTDLEVSTEEASLDEIAETMVASFGMSEVSHKNGLTYIELDADEAYDLICFYEGSETCWMVQFLCDPALTSQYQSTLMEYAQAVKAN